MLMTFTTSEKGLVVNKTNRTALVAAFGNETDDWNDQIVRLSIGQVLFQGRMVPSIVVHPVTETQSGVADQEKPRGKKK
jgi:hypothetical protein